ncbi:MAG: hypothetical protein N3B13_10310 [Deltaproteobacteria bacterium]|nr:hypothetical protein [Deltaproteobacteria bacterium]
MKKRFIQLRDSVRLWYDGLSQKEKMFVLIFLSSVLPLVIALSVINQELV